MPDYDAPEWLKNMVEIAEVKAGGRTALGRDVKISRSTIHSWFNGSEPKLSQIERISQYINYDLSEAFKPKTKNNPEWDKPLENHKYFQSLKGVQAGEFNLHKVFQNSKAWKKTKGEVSFLRLDTDEYFPEFPLGCLVAYREPTIDKYDLHTFEYVILSFPIYVDGEEEGCPDAFVGNFLARAFYSEDDSCFVYGKSRYDERLSVASDSNCKLTGLVVGTITPPPPTKLLNT